MSCAIIRYEVKLMNFPFIVKYTYEQASMSQAEMAHKLQISLITINGGSREKTTQTRWQSRYSLLFVLICN